MQRPLRIERGRPIDQSTRMPTNQIPDAAQEAAYATDARVAEFTTALVGPHKDEVQRSVSAPSRSKYGSGLTTLGQAHSAPVCVVELAALVDGNLVPHAVSAALGVAEHFMSLAEAEPTLACARREFNGQILFGRDLLETAA